VRTDFPEITEEQARKVWGDMITSGSYAFNAAHCVAYGLLAYWTMWFKVHYPSEFYAASVRHYGDHKQRDILRDADRHGIRILKPRVGRSEGSWKPDGGGRIRAGYSQIKGIGPKSAASIIEAEPADWDEMINIRGIGVKTIEKIKEWIAQEDPFDIYRLEKSITAVERELGEGRLFDGAQMLPFPTHTSRELDEAEQGTRVVWLGEVVRMNVRDIFEINVARGNTSDLENIRDPELREFAILYARDADDQTMLKVNRWRWPQFKADLFDLREHPDRLVLVAGRKPRYGVQVDKLWVIEP
jgi:DNA polymerase-3 subunit alpha